MPDLINGLGSTPNPVNGATFGEGVLTRNDDGSSAAINITSIFGPNGLNYFGTSYTSLYVNTNGNITFGGALSQYIAGPIGGGGLSRPIIAAYWMDIDTRAGVDNPSPGGTSTGSNLVYYDLDTDNHIFTATWDDVGYYSTHKGNPNAFQIRLIDVGNGDFDIEFRYETINQSASDTNNSPGEAPRAGYSNGRPAPNNISFELPDSRPGSYQQILQLDTNPGNTGQVGYYYFQVRGGEVMGGGPGGEGIPYQEPAPVYPVQIGLEQIQLQREGDDGITPYDVVITRQGPDLAGGSVVDWEIRLADPNDFAPGQPLSGSVYFAPGETRQHVIVNVQGDHTFEQDEWFQFTLTRASFGSESWDPGVFGMGVIVNDDPATSFLFSGPQTGIEGQVGMTPFEFAVLRAGDITQASTVNWRLDLGTADSLDLAPGQPREGAITFAPGQTQAVIEIQTLADRRVEPDETFTVRLTSAVTNGVVTELNAAALGTILDDDTRRTLLVASPTAIAAAEGDSGATAFDIVVMRVGDLAAAVQIPYVITLPSSAGLSVGEIQTPLSGIVSFAAGAAQASLTVLVTGDTTPEDNESFLVTLGGGAFNTLVVNGIVMNDDKVAGPAGAPEASTVGAPDEVSAFMQSLTGGGLWSNGGFL